MPPRSRGVEKLCIKGKQPSLVVHHRVTPSITKEQRVLKYGPGGGGPSKGTVRQDQSRGGLRVSETPQLDRVLIRKKTPTDVCVQEVFYDSSDSRAPGTPTRVALDLVANVGTRHK